MYRQLLHANFISSSVGATTTASENNFVGQSTNRCLVQSLNGTKIPGFYHQMQEHQLSAVEGLISYYGQWQLEYRAAGVSAGRYFCLSSAGVGRLTTHQIQLGPFVEQ